MSTTTLRSTTVRSAARRRTAQPHRSTLRLTRRGRAVVIGLMLLAVLSIVALRSAPAASTDLVHHPKTATVVVAPGETVWDIARRVAPGSDPRSVVTEIEQLNSLSDAGAIQVGQPLFVPQH